jgi:hypothetical protein
VSPALSMQHAVAACPPCLLGLPRKTHMRRLLPASFSCHGRGPCRCKSQIKGHGPHYVMPAKQPSFQLGFQPSFTAKLLPGASRFLQTGLCFRSTNTGRACAMFPRTRTIAIGRRRHILCCSRTLSFESGERCAFPRVAVWRWCG